MDQALPFQRLTGVAAISLPEYCCGVDLVTLNRFDFDTGTVLQQWNWTGRKTSVSVEVVNSLEIKVDLPFWELSEVFDSARQ